MSVPTLPADPRATIPRLALIANGDLPPVERWAIVALCSRAFAEDASPLFDHLANTTDPWHVLGWLGDQLVGHACWTTRGLQPDDGDPLRTAYADAVATDPDHQGRGIGSSAMRRLAHEVAARPYQIANLATSRISFYERLGWERWRGPTGVRTPAGVESTPGESVLILRTPRAPALDPGAPLTIEPRDGSPS